MKPSSPDVDHSPADRAPTPTTAMNPISPTPDETPASAPEGPSPTPLPNPSSSTPATDNSSSRSNPKLSSPAPTNAVPDAPTPFTSAPSTAPPPSTTQPTTPAAATNPRPSAAADTPSTDTPAPKATAPLPSTKPSTATARPSQAPPLDPKCAPAASTTPTSTAAAATNPRPSAAAPVLPPASNTASPTSAVTPPHPPAPKTGHPPSSIVEPAASSVVIVDHSDEEVREVAVETRKRDTHLPDFPPFSITDYDFVSGFANLRDVYTPTIYSREINEEHVENLKTRFDEKGFNPVLGCFIVVQRPDFHKPDWVADSDEVIGECAVVDGRHRFSAICDLYESDPEKWSQLWRKAPVSRVVRKDGDLISILEILALSSYFNELSSAVLKVSFLDYVHAAIQTTKVLATLKRTTVGDLSAGEIAKELMERRTLGDIDERQLRRYASVAQKVAQRDDYYKTIKSLCGSCPGIGLVHLHSRILFSFSNVDLWRLAIASIRSLVEKGVRGSFEVLHTSFYGCVRQMFDVVQQTASYRHMSLHTLMHSELHITAHITKTVFEYITDTMSRYASVENQDAADKTRVRNLKKKLVKLLGGAIEPIESGPDAVKAGASPSSAKTASPPKADSVDQDVASEEQTLRRSTRKRKAVVQESDDEFDESDAARPVKKSRSKTKAKSSASARGTNSSEQQTSALTMNTVSSFLRALPEAELTRLIGRLGIHVTSSRSSRATTGVGDANTAAWDSAKPLNVLPSFYDMFNDDLPDTIPEVWADPPAYTGPPQPNWLKFLTKIPSKWPTAIPIEHVTPWLDAMHVPHEHRAHSVITNVHILRQTHHSVFFHAAHSFHKQRRVSELPEFPPHFHDPVTTNEKLWASAVVEDEVALEFFGAKREQLSTEGFCILDGFLNDERIPDRVGNFTFHKVNSTRPFFKSLEVEARGSFPGEEALTNPAGRSTWNIMENVSSSVDSNAVIQGQGRFRMTNYGILERLEKDSDTFWTITGRALVDLRVAQCVAALKLTTKIGSKRLFMTRTGGRWIMTSEKCERQVLHTDFKALSRHDTLSDNKSPGYFTIATGEREVPIWVCSHSHRLAATTSASKVRAAASGSSVHLIRVPPLSVLVGRGDLYYSGAGSADSVGNERLLYYHNLFIPDGDDIPKVVYMNPNFKPRFTATLDEDSDDDSEEDPPSARNPVGSVKKPKVIDQSDDEYCSDEIREANEDDDEVDYSQYL